MECVTLLITFVLYLVTSTEGTYCPSSVRGYFGQNILIECNFLHPLVGVYWFDETDEVEPLIRLEHGIKAGKGYQSGEYDVTTNGSLVIRDAKWTNDMIYTVVIIDSEYSDYTPYTKVSVLEHCPVNQCSLAGEEATIVCHFKPGFIGVYWFETEGDDEPLIRLEGSHKSGSSQKYDIHNNGSLIIRRVPNDYQNTFFVLLLSITHKEWSNSITFQAVHPCGLLSSPMNGGVNQTGRVAMFICDEGYQLIGSRQRFCIFHQMTETPTWVGTETLCILDSKPRVTTVRISDASTPGTRKKTPAFESTEGQDEETRPTELPERKSTTKEYGNNLLTRNKSGDTTFGSNIPPLPPNEEDESHAGSSLRSLWTLVTLMQAKITFPTSPPVVAGNICHLFIYYSPLRALIVDLKRIHSVFPGVNSQICVGMRRAETVSASVVHLEKGDSGEKKLCALEVVPHSGQWL